MFSSSLDFVSKSYLCCCSDSEDQGEDKEFAAVTLKDFVRVETLGMGGFGRVELVRHD